MGRGMKGAGARKSSSMPLYFEGGQLPLTKRLPMIRGKSRFQSFGKVAEVNVGDLQKISADKITLETLKLHGLADPAARAAKVIATGKVDKALQLECLRVSAGAKKLIEAAGGSVENDDQHQAQQKVQIEQGLVCQLDEFLLDQHQIIVVERADRFRDSSVLARVGDYLVVLHPAQVYPRGYT